MRMIYALIALFAVLLAPPAEAARIKDVAEIYGKPDISLMGTGLVAGLNRTGDSTRNQATIQQIVNRLQGHRHRHHVRGRQARRQHRRRGGQHG
jgi:flagellar basal body P-ring protein FlgI